MNFRNEPILDLRLQAERQGLVEALSTLDRELPLKIPVVVDGKCLDGAGLDSVDPGAPDRLVARSPVAAAAEVDAAVSSAAKISSAWAGLSVRDRGEILLRAAEVMRSTRHRFAALMVRECAKPWSEADADVCEAIDFLEFYAAQAERLATRNDLSQVAGERNDLYLRGRGVAAVIAPWNFPVAILTGMTAAALVMGNPVVMKPAEQSPACGFAVFEAFREAGVPEGVLHFLPGEGETGAALSAHTDVQTIAFTGSGSVGQAIIHQVSEPDPERRNLKRVIAEMGGKNCIILDSDTDLDDAVPAIFASAFGFAGQKCSAGSRLLLHSSIADTALERLAGALGTLKVGQAAEFGIDVPPVIEAATVERVERYIALSESEGAEVLCGFRPEGPGHFVAPTLVTGLAAGAPILWDELFAPVLAVQTVDSLEEACDLVDELPFALTGGLFSRNPENIRYVVDRTPVGNLYVNRNTTGAMVGRQPFGGNRLSGTGTKAGGRDYLLSFADPIVVSENIVRHGLAV